MSLKALQRLLNQLAAQYEFNPRYVEATFHDGYLVIEGIDKEHELVVYSDLSHELKTI